MQTKLAMEVTVIDWSWGMSFPPVMIIGAVAKISGGSAHNHRLVARNKGALSTDGYLELDFLSDHPALTTDNIVKARSAPYLVRPPSGLQGVRVFGEKGNLSKSLSGASIEDVMSEFSKQSISMKTQGGGDVFPWSATSTSGIGDPFPWAQSLQSDPDLTSIDILALPVKTLIGRHCRAYKNGDMLTKDFRPDRLNIEFATAEMRTIVQIWMG